jgi:ArsR family transcriptional regulator
MNINTRLPENKISRLLEIIGKPARLQILLAIGTGEACVCHLESMLGMRQAMRSARVLAARRSGRYIYYRLRDPALLDFIHQAGHLAGVSHDRMEALIHRDPISQCECPNCAATQPAEPVPNDRSIRLSREVDG